MRNLLVILFLFGFISNAQYTQVPDPNFEQALIDLGYDDVIDGQFLTANALGVLTLNVDEKSINDLTGIEAFVDLDQLFAYGNFIQYIDLSNLPETLWTLDLGNNNLSNIDLSPIPQVVNLYLSSNNFTQIDASNLSNLFIFHVSNQNLLSLNLTNCTNLFSLGCVETSLQTIDLTDCTNLAYLNCHDSQLISLDFSENFEMLEVRCYNNPLTSINLPNNPNLEYLSVSNTLLTDLDVTNCPGLQILNFYDTPISQIDLSNNIVLERLACVNSQLTSLDITNNPNLIELWCRNNNISGIIDFSNNPILDDIDLQYNQLEEADFSQNPVLTFISIDDNPNLQFINMQNGFNENLIALIAIDCPQLSCIVVDDPNAPNENIFIDPHTTLVDSVEDCEDLSVNDHHNINISIYPNPVSDLLHIEAQEVINSISISNVLGQVLYHSNVDALETSIDMSSYAKGTYFVKVNVGAIVRVVKVIR